MGERAAEQDKRTSRLFDPLAGFHIQEYSLPQGEEPR